MRVLVTGASGFVGAYLSEFFCKNGVFVRSAYRKKNTSNKYLKLEKCYVGNIDSSTDWKEALRDIDCVVHLAARAHIVIDRAKNPLEEFRRVNVNGTINLANQAARAGVKRFIFISSVKVNGEQTELGKPFTVEDTPVPVDPYGISKYEAEVLLQNLSQSSIMELVVIRPPLVYGPGVKANFLSLMRWINSGIPLPLASVHNLRSLVSLYNLAEFILLCTRHPSASNKTFFVSDGDDLSTIELVRRMAKALNVPARILPVSDLLFRSVSKVLGKNAIYQRLHGSLQVDDCNARELLGWKPTMTVEESLDKTVHHFLASAR